MRFGISGEFSASFPNYFVIWLDTLYDGSALCKAFLTRDNTHIKTWEFIDALCGIQTHNPSFRASKTTSSNECGCHCRLPVQAYKCNILFSLLCKLSYNSNMHILKQVFIFESAPIQLVNNWSDFFLLIFNWVLCFLRSINIRQLIFF